MPPASDPRLLRLTRLSARTLMDDIGVMADILAEDASLITRSKGYRDEQEMLARYMAALRPMLPDDLDHNRIFTTIFASYSQN